MPDEVRGFRPDLGQKRPGGPRCCHPELWPGLQVCQSSFPLGLQGSRFRILESSTANEPRISNRDQRTWTCNPWT